MVHDLCAEEGNAVVDRYSVDYSVHHCCCHVYAILRHVSALVCARVQSEHGSHQCPSTGTSKQARLMTINKKKKRGKKTQHFLMEFPASDLGVFGITECNRSELPPFLFKSNIKSFHTNDEETHVFPFTNEANFHNRSKCFKCVLDHGFGC